MNALRKLKVANGESTSYVRQPVAKRMANPWPNRYEIMCFERCLDIEVTYRRSAENRCINSGSR